MVSVRDSGGATEAFGRVELDLTMNIDFDFDDRKIQIQNQQRQMFKDSTRR